MANMVNCPYCGKLTNMTLDNCPHCGGFLQKAKAEPAKAGPAARQTCPHCHALVKEGDIICVACGTNLLTGQKVSREKNVEERTDAKKWFWIGLIAAVGVLVLLVLLALMVIVAWADPVDKALRLSAAGRTSEATNRLSEHVRKRPDDQRALFELGRIHWFAHQFTSAAEAFGRVEAKNRDAALLTSVCRALAGGEGVSTEEIASLERFVAQFPDDGEGWYVLGLARGAKGDMAGQSEALGKASALAFDTVKARRQLGIAKALEKNYDRAAAELQMAVDEGANDADLLAAAGLVAALREPPAQAVAKLRAALDANPALRTEVLTQLGLLLVAQGQYGEADTYLTQALANKTNDPTLRLFHAICLKAKPALPDALTEFDALAQGDSPFAADAAMLAAEIYLSLGEHDRALDSITRAVNLRSNSAPIKTLEGRIQMAMGNAAAAQEAFQTAIRLDPSYAPAHLENGIQLLRREAVAEGIRELERYLSLVPLANRNAPLFRYREVEAFVTQLKQTMQAPNPAAPAAEGRRGMR